MILDSDLRRSGIHGDPLALLILLSGGAIEAPLDVQLYPDVFV